MTTSFLLIRSNLYHHFFLHGGLHRLFLGHYGRQFLPCHRHQFFAVVVLDDTLQRLLGLQTVAASVVDIGPEDETVSQPVVARCVGHQPLDFLLGTCIVLPQHQYLGLTTACLAIVFAIRRLHQMAIVVVSRIALVADEAAASHGEPSLLLQFGTSFLLVDETVTRLNHATMLSQRGGAAQAPEQTLQQAVVAFGIGRQPLVKGGGLMVVAHAVGYVGCVVERAFAILVGTGRGHRHIVRQRLTVLSGTEVAVGQQIVRLNSKEAVGELGEIRIEARSSVD